MHLECRKDHFIVLIVQLHARHFYSIRFTNGKIRVLFCSVLQVYMMSTAFSGSIKYSCGIAFSVRIHHQTSNNIERSGMKNMAMATRYDETPK